MVDVMRPENDVAAACGVFELESVLPQDKGTAHGEVVDERRDEPRDVPRHPDVRGRRSGRRRAA
jgi:hypothetical protein